MDEYFDGEDFEENSFEDGEFTDDDFDFFHETDEDDLRKHLSMFPGDPKGGWGRLLVYKCCLDEQHDLEEAYKPNRRPLCLTGATGFSATKDTGSPGEK